MAEPDVVHPPESVPDKGSEVVTEPLGEVIPRPLRERPVESWPESALVEWV
jgi:hypothetical protein